MYGKDPLELIGRVIFCSARFEGLVSKLYEQIAGKIRSRAVSLSLGWLSARSRSNAEFLSRAASVLGVEESDEDCRSVVGLPWRLVEEVMSMVSDTEHFDGELPALLFKKLDPEEGLIGVEAYHKILFNALGNVLSSLKVAEDVGMLSGVLREMSREEEFHEELLRKCRSLLSL